MWDDPEAYRRAVRRARLWTGATALLSIVVLLAVWASIWNQILGDDQYVRVALPADGSLPPPVGGLHAAIEAMSGDGGLFVSPAETVIATLRQADAAGCKGVTIFPFKPVAALGPWISGGDGLGWGSQSATLRAQELLVPRIEASIAPGGPQAAALMQRLGRPSRRMTEAIYQMRGGSIFPGGPEFRKARQVQVGEYDVLTYESAGLTFYVLAGAIERLEINLSALPDDPPVEALFVGRWAVDRQAYRSMVQGLIPTARDERWRAEYQAMADAAEAFELLLEIHSDGTGYAEWTDLVWMSNPNGFRVDRQAGAHDRGEFRWWRGPGGIRLVMPTGGGGNRVVGLAFIEDQLSIDTRHSRELRLARIE